MSLDLSDIEYLQINGTYYSELSVQDGTTTKKIWEAPSTSTEISYCSDGVGVLITGSPIETGRVYDSIRYTTNGSTPTKDSTKYPGGILKPTSSCTIKAITIKEHYKTGPVVSAIYTDCFVDKNNNKYYFSGTKEDPTLTRVKINVNDPDLIIPSVFKVVPAGVFNENDISPYIRTVVIPSSIKSIEPKAFKGCSNLSSVEFQETSPFTIGNEAFSGCSRLSLVDFLAVGDNFINCSIGDGTNRNVWTGCPIRIVKITKGNFSNELRYYYQTCKEGENFTLTARCPWIQFKGTGGRSSTFWSASTIYFHNFSRNISGGTQHAYYYYKTPSDDSWTEFVSEDFYDYESGEYSRGDDPILTNWNFKPSSFYCTEARCGNNSKMGIGITCYGMGHANFDYAQVSNSNYNFTHNGRIGVSDAYGVEFVSSPGDVGATSAEAVKDFDNKDSTDTVENCLYTHYAKRAGGIDTDYWWDVRWIDFMIPIYNN